MKVHEEIEEIIRRKKDFEFIRIPHVKRNCKIISTVGAVKKDLGRFAQRKSQIRKIYQVNTFWKK